MGLAWSLATFFIMPVMVTERLSLRASIARSAQIMKDHFGRAIGFDFGTRILMAPALLMLAMFALYMGALALTRVTGSEHALFFKLFAVVFLCIILILLLLGLIGMQAVTWVFTCAIYNFSQGKPTGPFNERLIRASEQHST